jgi:ankyrin repeat protein
MLKITSPSVRVDPYCWTPSPHPKTIPTKKSFCVTDLVDAIVEMLKGPALQSDQNRISLQELVANILRIQQQSMVSLMPQITSTAQWLINFPQTEDNDSIAMREKGVNSTSNSHKVVNTGGSQVITSAEQLSNSATFITGESKNGRQRAASFIAHELVVTAPNFLICRTSINNLGLPSDDQITPKMVAQSLAKIINFKVSQIESKIIRKEVLIMLDDIGSSNNEASQANVNKEIVRKLSRLSISLILPIEESEIPHFSECLEDKVTQRVLEVMPSCRSSVSQTLKRKLNCTAVHCETTLTNIQYYQHHLHVLSEPSNIPIYCSFMTGKSSIPSNMFSLFENYVKSQLFGLGESREHYSETHLYIDLIKCALSHYDRSVTFDSKNDLSKLECIFVVNALGAIEFTSNYVLDFLVASSFLVKSKMWSPEITLKQVFSEPRFRLVRRFIDNFFSLEENQNSFYVGHEHLLNEIIAFAHQNLLELVCTEGLCCIFQRALKVKMAMEKDWISSEQLQSCLFSSCSSNGTIALSLISSGVDLLSLIEKHLSYGVLHRVASTGDCELMSLVLEKVRESQEIKLHCEPKSESSQDDKIHKTSAVSSDASQYVKTIVNKRFDMQCAPLHVAVERGHLEMVKLLISQGASCSLVDNFRNRWTPLHYAIFNGHYEITNELLKSICVRRFTPFKDGTDWKLPYEITVDWASHELARMGWSLGLNLLLEKGVDSVAKTYDSFATRHRGVVAFSEYQDLLFFAIENRDKIVHDSLKGRGVAFVAIEMNRSDVLSILLRYGDDCFAEDVEGWTLAHVAAETGSTKLIRCLSRVGKLGTRNNDKATPLDIAVSKGHTDALKTLIEIGATPTFTSLCQATLRNDRICCEILLNSNVPTLGRKEETPLHFAAAQASVKSLELLIELKFDPSRKDKFGHTPMHEAAVRKDDTGCLQWLLTNGLNPNVQSTLGQTPLHLACKVGSIEATRMLLNHDADPNIVDSNGYNAVHHAAGSADCVKLLLERGNVCKARKNDDYTKLQLVEGTKVARSVSVRRETNFSQQLQEIMSSSQKQFLEAMRPSAMTVESVKGSVESIHAAVYTGNQVLLERLLKEGQGVNSTNWIDGQTPLHLATLRQNLSLMRILVKAGADINARNANYETPLHIAAKYGDLRIGRFLIESGASLITIGHRGYSALHTALESGHGKFAEMLLEKGANPNTFTTNGTALHLAAENVSEPTTLRLLVDKGANFMALDSLDRRPIHCAALGGQLENVKYLQSLDTKSLEVRGHMGNTVLHFAVQGGHLQVVEYLVAQGADCYSANFRDQIPLQLAMNYECVKFLKTKMQDMNLKVKPVNPRNQQGVVIVHLPHCSKDKY